MEAKTMTLVDELGQHCGCYSDRDQHHHCVACRAIDALEAARKALEPFALTLGAMEKRAPGFHEVQPGKAYLAAEEPDKP